jgi:hypothetical protein
MWQLAVIILKKNNSTEDARRSSMQEKLICVKNPPNGNYITTGTN